MAKDVKVFVQNCLHCVTTITGDKVPAAWYAATRNQANRDPPLRFPLHWVVNKREVSVLTACEGWFELIIMACAVSQG
jgi:hypothetical protein